MKNYYPNGTSTAINLEYLFKGNKTDVEKRMSVRIVKTATFLEDNEHIGWQMYIPPKGMAEISLFGSESVQKRDLEWISENMGQKSSKNSHIDVKADLTELYELHLPILGKDPNSNSAFGLSSNWKKECKQKWPNTYFTQFEEMIKVLREDGAFLRVVLGAVNEEGIGYCQKSILSSYDISDIQVSSYIGKPVRLRILFLLPSQPSIRLRSIVEGSINGAAFRYLGNMKKKNTMDKWNHPLKNSDVYPELAARVMVLEPIAKETISGVEVREEDSKPILACHTNSSSKKSITIGKATTTAGINRNITLADVDLRRHFQIIGQTGTGKSTLLSNMILSAITKGYGLTFFDPHGTTIDVILHSLPQKYANRVRVVRIGDEDNPVPLKIWDSSDPEKEEKNISQLCELFREIFDPNNQGYVGPRYERWLSTFAKASIALLKDAASFESICVLSQNQDNMFKLYKKIKMDYPDLADIIRYEYGTDKSNDFVNMINWYLCKFQRLCSIKQLRNTLGAPVNALDFKNTIDSDTVTLIDLASPTIGTNASRIMGTLLLMKLWEAAQERKNKDQTHMVVLDEAALFQTEPLPSMLGQARKFGLSIVMCHQHLGQLSTEVSDALEANSANFCAFRLSSKDAYNATIRFDDEKLINPLTRLNAFNAITTISVDGIQTKPFTLQVHRPKEQANGNVIAESIEENSIRTLVEPYREKRALSTREIQKILNDGDTEADKTKNVHEKRPVVDESKNIAGPHPEWVKRYLNEKPA